MLAKLPRREDSRMHNSCRGFCVYKIKFRGDLRWLGASKLAKNHFLQCVTVFCRTRIHQDFSCKHFTSLSRHCHYALVRIRRTTPIASMSFCTCHFATFRALGHLQSPLRLPQRLRGVWRGLRRVARHVANLPQELLQELEASYPSTEYAPYNGDRMPVYQED